MTITARRCAGPLRDLAPTESGGDEALLANLFTRALKEGLLDLTIQARPPYTVQLEAGQNTFEPTVLDLTAHEVEVIRRRSVS